MVQVVGAGLQGRSGRSRDDPPCRKSSLSGLRQAVGGARLGRKQVGNGRRWPSRGPGLSKGPAGPALGRGSRLHRGAVGTHSFWGAEQPWVGNAG